MPRQRRQRRRFVVKLQTGATMEHASGIDELIDRDFLDRYRPVLIKPIQIDRFARARPVVPHVREGDLGKQIENRLSMLRRLIMFCCLMLLPIVAEAASAPGTIVVAPWTSTIIDNS